MRAIRVLLLLLPWTVLAGCGEDGDGSAPRISSLRYTSDRYLVGFGGGRALLTGQVEAMDPDGDLAFLRASDQVCGQGPWRHLDTPVEQAAAGETISVPLLTVIRTDCPAGAYHVEVSLFDARKNQSEILDAPFTLFEAE
ncbi:MAG: hypothetical protein AB1640_05720 [bacterium]